MTQTDELQPLLNWLRTAPDLDGAAITVDYLGSAATAQCGLYPAGVRVLATKRDVCGAVTLRCRRGFVLRLALPQAPGDDDAASATAERLQRLQAWVAAQSVRGKAPRFGNGGTETLYLTKAKLESWKTEGFARYSAELTAEYTMKYEV